MTRRLPLLLLVPLAACGDPGYRGVESQHQPVVADGRALVRRCPDWSDQDRGNTEANTANYGCATSTNLALMVADPNDLVRGRSDGANSPDVGTRAIKAWREVQPSSKVWTTTSSVSSKGGGQ